MATPETSRLKSVFDRSIAAAALLLISPVLALVAIAIMIDDGFPIFFRQVRIGRHGVPFQILKFRSMRTNSQGAAITRANDGRVTRAGHWLRRLKIDELPQLWNVLRGEMGLVGPRPEVPRYVDCNDPIWRAVLAVRPGMTDFASLLYRDEESMLAGPADPETHYRRVILPEKLKLNMDYIRGRSFWLDLKLILLTARYSFFPVGFDPQRIYSKLFPGR